MNKELLIYGGLLALGLGAGFGGGYILAKKRFQAYADEEIEQVKETYKKLAAEKPSLEEVAVEKDYDIVPPAPTASELGYIPGDHNPSGESFVEVPDEVVRARTEFADAEAEVAQNLFDREDDAAAFKQSELHPFLISVGAWHDPDSDEHAKVTLVYYEGDNTLADEADTIIDNVEAIVGDKALTFFGPRSRAEDDNIVYVRNIPFGSDYEIHRRKDSYREIVLGE